MKINTRTLIVGLSLVGIFMLIFVAYQARNKNTSPETSSTPSPTTSSSFVPNPPSSDEYSNGTLFIVSTTPSTTPILPYSTINITLSADPLTNGCSLSSSLDATDVTIKTVGNSFVVSPTNIWEPGSTLVFHINCTNLRTAVTLLVKSTNTLTESESFQLEAANAKQIGQSRQAYLKEHSYISAFPLNRESYFLLYIEVNDYIYVVSKDGTPFTSEAQTAIQNTEREKLTKLGVPPSVPFVFAGSGQ